MHHVCFCFSDGTGTYYQHPLVTMISLFEHTLSRVCVHILSDETFSPEKEALFKAACERYGQELRVYNMGGIPPETLNKVSPTFGKGSLYRLFIPDFVQDSPVLYLDCDVIVTLDIKDLFALTLGNSCVGGVLDSGQTADAKSSNYLEKLDIIPGRYINSGVLLLDTDKLRTSHPDMKERVFDFIAKHTLRYPDQDALNHYFHKLDSAVSFFPERFNFVTGIADRAYLAASEYEDKIVHFTSGKPWQAMYPAALLYWKYYCRYFPAADAFAAMERLERHKFLYLFTFLLRNPRLRRWVNRLYDIDTKGLGPFFLERLMPSRKKRRQ